MEKFRLNKSLIKFIKKPEKKGGRLVQGLLGVGQVGYLAGKQLIKSLNAEKIAEMYSPYFLYPGAALPGVIYEKDGSVDLSKNEIYFSEEHNIFILSGLYQGLDPSSYFELANLILDFCDEFEINEIYTLGGYGESKIIDEPKVYGVFADEKGKELIEKFNIDKIDAPEGVLGVTGLAGILVPMAAKNNKLAVCLLGQTHGAYPDPKAAKAVLLKLCEVLGIEVKTEDLDEQIEEMEREIAKAEEALKKALVEATTKPQPPREGEFPYIG